MAIESKHHRPSPVERVLVSEGTREDASGIKLPKFESYDDELEYWKAQKRKTESVLAGFSKAAFSAEQARIRREFRNNADRSFKEWMSRKASMEHKRQQLIEKKVKIEDEILRLKPLAKAEKKRIQLVRTKDSNGKQKNHGKGLDEFEVFRDDGTLSWDGAAAQILIELKAIRGLLERLRECNGGRESD